MAKPAIDENEINAVVEVMRSGMLAAGPKVLEFESAFAEYVGVDNAVASCNGTTALHLAFLALGVGSGDKVITTPFTFIASSNSILFSGAVPVFVDVVEDTMLLDPDAVERYLASADGASVKAILAVHLFGHPCDMARLRCIADEYGVYLIEDCAQAHGAKIGSDMVGAFGDAACFSFYPTKNMTTGEGGMTLFRELGHSEIARKYANHGRMDQYLHDVIGYNYRMTSISAAIGIEQLTKLPALNERRQENARYYDTALSNIDCLTLPAKWPDCTHVYHQYTIRVNAPYSRDELGSFLTSQGISSAVIYPMSTEQQPAYMGRCIFGELPCSNTASSQVLSIPVHPALDKSDVEKVANAIQEFFSKPAGGI